MIFKFFEIFLFVSAKTSEIQFEMAGKIFSEEEKIDFWSQDFGQKSDGKQKKSPGWATSVQNI